MPNEKISVLNSDNENPDKMKIALAIRNAVHEYNNLSCSLIDNNIINGCCNCSLNFLCKKIDEAAKDYSDSISTVINTFNFQGVEQ